MFYVADISRLIQIDLDNGGVATPHTSGYNIQGVAVHERDATHVDVSLYHHLVSAKGDTPLRSWPPGLASIVEQYARRIMLPTLLVLDGEILQLSCTPSPALPRTS